MTNQAAIHPLEIRDLCFSYEDEPVLRGVDFRLEASELVALVGENGAGKSTLMKLVLSQLRPQSGEVLLFGDPVAKDNHHADIAYVSQDAVRGYKHFPTTIEELVAVHRRHLHVKKDMDELLHLVRLEGHEKKKLNQLSGGQLQRVGLLVALVKDARLVLLDEPTTGVDAKFSVELYQILERLAQAGKTVLVITHHLSEAAPFANRVVRLKGGTLEDLPRKAWQGSVL